METLVKQKTNPYVNMDIFELRKTNFVLWLPVITDQTPFDAITDNSSGPFGNQDVTTLSEEVKTEIPEMYRRKISITGSSEISTGESISAKDILPRVYISQVNYDYVDGSFSFHKIADKPLIQSVNFPDLWLLELNELNLQENSVYYYWFIIRNTNPYENNNNILYCTDPFATVIDERIQAQDIPVLEINQNHYSPASVFMYKNGEMITADPDGELPNWENLSTDKVIDMLPSNKNLVIYELPLVWSYPNKKDINEPGFTADANFRQAEKMIAFDSDDTYLDHLFSGIPDLKGKKYLEFLGINAFECCPPANSIYTGGWRYGTTNYFSPDYTLSNRIKQNVASPKTSTDFVRLVKACHKKGIRVFYDAVMAFSKDSPYRHINFPGFFIEWKDPNHKENPDFDTEQGNRDGFGGDLVRYKRRSKGFNPNITSDKPSVSFPAREFMKAHLKEWIKNKGISGIRIDSVNNIDCYNFMQEIKNEMTGFFMKTMNGTEDKILIVGEELGVPADLLGQNRLHGLWNEIFKKILREVILGKSWEDNNFEWSVRKMIDSRLLNRNFNTTTQAINYITSHDTGGFKNERMFNYLNNNGVINTEKPVKLAFACLMTAIGIPMVLAGEEFADAQDLFSDNEKQNDGVSFERLKSDAWRQDIFMNVARLIRLRTRSEALCSENLEFIHSDFDIGKRIMAWKREKGEDIVITVANFSDWGSGPDSEYIIHNWPLFNGSKTPANKKWIEISQKRFVPDEWIGREGIYPWEAKVYTLADIDFDIENL